MATKDAARRAEHNRTYYEKHKQEVLARNKAKKKENSDYIRAIKTLTPCADCDRFFPAVAMDFDHIGNDKVDHVTTLAARGVSKARLDEEIAKCEVVCACCHRVRTAERLALVAQWQSN